MRLGIGSYTYVWSVGVPGYPQPDRPWTAWDLLDKAAGLSVGVLQIADNLPLDRLSESELAALVGRAAALGIDLEVGTAGLDRQHLLRYLELATRLGSPVLRVLTDTARHQPTPDEVVTMLGEVRADFERAGVTLAIENHDRFSSSTLLEIVQRADSPRVGICFDTANSIGCLERPAHVLDVLESHIVNVHAKDYCLFRPPHHKGFIVEGRPAGQGQLDLPSLVERLSALGRSLSVILELWPPPQATLEDSMALEERWTRESVLYLRNLIVD